MGRLGKGTKNFSAVIPDEQYAYVQKRARRLDLSFSSYGAMIVDHWIKQGAPPLTESDHLLPGLPAPKAADRL